jgi:nitroreductase
MTTHNGRTADHPIDPRFLARWSPRAFTGEPIPLADLLTILEAARWAPSSSNVQPWRFLYALRDSADWPLFLSLLVDANAAWATRAAALIFIVSKTTVRRRGGDEDVPSYTHSFDAGAAWSNLALQALALGWHTHGMAGIHRERAVAELHIPPGYRIEAAVAVGRLGEPTSLPDALREREVPSAREPLSSIAFEGRFPAPPA